MNHAAHAIDALHHAVTAPQIWWLLGLPLAAFTLLIFCGRRLGGLAPWVTVASLAGAFGLTLSLHPAIAAGQRLVVDWTWLPQSRLAWTLGLSVDGLTWIMLFVVTGIATMIAVYSIGYMHGDARFSRFFAYLALFCFSMLLLVLANHFLVLYAGWELVGLCSYFLISFWFEKPEAAAAGRKAFITTRIGDTGLFLGILLLAFAGGTLRFDELHTVASQLPPALLTAISTLIFFGAVGKSAQFPLHVWLPDAMEGPTPVSALIHAATMVAAGVYLVARTAALFTPQSLQLVLALGLITHLFASTIALTQNDVKRMLAYSTLSHLGFMMVALGIGAVSAAMFHLFTHAFFKALLFLAAGSIIHGTGHQDITKMGGLHKYMPITSLLFLIGGLSLSGTFLLSGFWSKDAILIAAEPQAWLFWTLLASAVMTAAYTFRVYFRVFFGAEPHHAPPNHGHGHAAHPHESPASMTVPMGVLCLGAAFIGLVESPWFGHPFLRLLGDHHGHDHIDPVIAVLSTGALVIGVALAWMIGFQRRKLVPHALRPLTARLYTLAANKYYIDEIYQAWIIQPAFGLADRLAGFDQRVIDGAVNLVGTAGRVLGDWKAHVDRVVVDRAVNGVATAIRETGAQLRRIQTGIIQQYLFVVVCAVVVLSFVLRR